MNIVVIALFAITMVAIAKYKPVYKVTLGDQEIGYVTNRFEFEKKINNDLLENDEETVLSSEIEVKPQYELKLVAHSTQTNEEEILDTMEASVKTIYKMYAITLDGEITEYVETLEEAETLVETLKGQYSEEVTSKIGITEVYTENKEEQVTEYMLAKVSTGDLVREVVQEEEEKQSHTLNGVYFANKPVTGRISSRFGSKESIRTHTHKGIDIAAPNGTPIYAAADGVIKSAGMNYGGYGNLVIIDHGNGVRTLYAHCSSLDVSVGEEVTQGQVVGKVGMTGYATGNHLHFEVHINNRTCDPFTYIAR